MRVTRFFCTFALVKKLLPILLVSAAVLLMWACSPVKHVPEGK